MSNVSIPSDVSQVSAGWLESAIKAGGKTPATVAGELSLEIVRLTALLAAAPGPGHAGEAVAGPCRCGRGPASDGDGDCPRCAGR